MKLSRQPGIKAAIVTMVVALMAVFFNLVKAEPMTTVAADVPISPTPNFDTFFAPGTSGTPTSPPVDRVQPHTRSRSS